MQSITYQISELIKTSIRSIFPEIIDVSEYNAFRGMKADYQFSKVKTIAKIVGLPNDVVASKIHDALFHSDLIQFVETINNETQLIIVFNVNKTCLESMINQLYSTTIQDNSLPPPIIQNLPKNVLIDFSSPNIAKEMHVGHLRSTIIGESMCRIFEYSGCNLKRINHIGDWGTQFGMLIAYIKQNNILDYDLTNLMLFYKASRKLFESDENFKSNAHQETVKLQQGNLDNLGIWKQICQISIDAFNKIYQQLGTHAVIKGESFYQELMIEMVQELDNVLVIKDGMKLLFAKDIQVPLIIVKSDGGFGYDTSDLAAVRYRLLEEKVDLVLYVVDSGQQQHFDTVFSVAKNLGWAKENQLKHVAFGLVLGPDGKKLKTRSGETIKLRDLLDQSYLHSKKVTTDLAKEKHPDWTEAMIADVSQKIAINCIKYTDLKNPRMTNYKFDLDKMVSTKGNTAVYLMYALARCKSILRKIPNLESIIQGEIKLENEEARKLAFKVVKYCEVINEAIDELSPHYLCNYLYDLVSLLTTFYDKNRCIEFNAIGEIVHIYEHRVRLIKMVLIVISKIFDLIGLEQIDQI